MTFAPDPRLDEARALPIDEVASRLGIEGLRRSTRELIGPCPVCGGDDRFSINTAKGVFQCRKGCAKGDGIELVKWVQGVDLPGALAFLCGPRQEISEAEREKRRQAYLAEKARREREEQRYRAKAIAEARRIWGQGQPAEGSPVRGYLALRGFGVDRLPRLPACLRYHPDLPYMVKDGDAWVEAHRGPAMLAAVQAPDGSGTAVHRTWIDLSRPRGKARIEFGGERLKVKKGFGAKKGCAIRLATPRAFDTLVMAEGIETTLTALVSGLFPGAAFWAAIDLGNIAGVMRKVEGVKHSGIPDMDDVRAFVPPPWVRRLVLVEDGDSDPAMTRAKLLSGARRAMALVPGLAAEVVPCPAGADLNDVLIGGGDG